MPVFKAEIQDAPEVIELLKRAHSEISIHGLPFDTERVIEVVAMVLTNGAIFCCRSGENLTGILMAFKGPSLYNFEPIASKIVWYVDPDFRNTRVGIQLHKAFEDWGKFEGCYALVMSNMPNSFSQSTEKFYLKKDYTLSEQTYVKRIK